MKSKLIAALAVACVIASSNFTDEVVSQQPTTAPSVLQELAPPYVPGTIIQPDGVMTEGMIVEQSLSPQVVHSVHVPCNVCGCHECCCDVPVNLCLVEPGCGCSYDICVHVPSCCVGHEPIVTWRKGILGRKIAHLCWSCCDKRVKVVVTPFGKARVWD